MTFHHPCPQRVSFVLAFLSTVALDEPALEAMAVALNGRQFAYDVLRRILHTLGLD